MDNTIKAPAGAVQAETHSDDYRFEINFDAEPWFQQASDEEIINLLACGFRGDYPADAVALYFEDSNLLIRNMLAYCLSTKDLRQSVGFECVVDPEDAMRWVKTQRPALFNAWSIRRKQSQGARL